MMGPLNKQMVALRCYSRLSKRSKWTPTPKPYEPPPEKVLVFDTETTIDELQNLTFGCCKVFKSGILERKIIFHSGCLNNVEFGYLQDYTQRNGFDLMVIDQFREVFLSLAYDQGALVVGYNLPFDLTRIAIDVVPGRGHNNGAFSVRLWDNNYYPHLIIRHLDSTKSFINFSTSFQRGVGNNKHEKQQQKHFKGKFLDLRTVTFALTNKKMGLAKACKHFKATHQKMDVEEHGKITPHYIDYNVADVDATYSLYLRVKEEFKRYNLNLPLTKLLSPASIGKAYLKEMGIRSFRDKNPDFPEEVIGNLMTTFYGGRSEVRIRKNPVQVVYMDVFSMYPTVCTKQNMWQFVICDHIEQEECTEEAIQLLDDIDLERLTDPNIWKELQIMCLVEPEGDILPVRSRYGNKHTFNIGLNHLTSETPIWYSIFDVISSKLLNKQIPKIIRAVRFKPVGIQDGLQSIDMLDNANFNPMNDDFFRRMIELRKAVKDELNERLHIGIDDDYTDQLRTKEHIIKIITNSTSYGIFVQLDSDKLNEEKDFDVFGLEHFNTKMKKNEKFGKMFNPIMGTFITSAARMMLAISERILINNGEMYAFCDTDSMAVPIGQVDNIMSYFQRLNPYSFETDIFEMEKENYHYETGELEPLWFYGISSKRYVLYNMTNDGPKIRKHSSHGLGHLQNPFKDKKDWKEALWYDILRCVYHPDEFDDIVEQYTSRFAVSQMTLTTPDMEKRLKKLNKNKDYRDKIKPFNFIHIGISVETDRKTGEPVKPIVPYSQDHRKAPYSEFIDYNSGKRLQGKEYWKTMDEVFLDYFNHPESKFEGDKGILRRRHLSADRIIYLGKEANKIEETDILGVGHEDIVVYIPEEKKRMDQGRPVFGVIE